MFVRPCSCAHPLLLKTSSRMSNWATLVIASQLTWPVDWQYHLPPAEYVAATYGDVKWLFEGDSFVLRTSEVHQTPPRRQSDARQSFEELHCFFWCLTAWQDLLWSRLLAKLAQRKRTTIKEINEEMRKIWSNWQDKKDCRQLILVDLQLRSDAFSGVNHFLTAHHVPSVNIGIFFASKSKKRVI